MSADPAAPIHFSREIDYLEDVGAKLRNLQGFTTLAHELIQNADDVPKVSVLTFNVCHDALVVENDGRFSDCGRPDLPECVWKGDPANGSHRCDFHRFRFVAGADKRNEPGTTGAFGIGFISVYQITDRPELISGRHWIIDESEEPNHRITQCPGCNKCRDTSLPGTRFLLPWASDPNSNLRQKLRAEPTSENTPAAILVDLETSLPTAMLFLKNLSIVEIRQEGRLCRQLQRLQQDGSLLLKDGVEAKDTIWTMLNGDFVKEAAELRRLHPNRIEQKRSCQVVLAIPNSPMESGLLCACLPSQHRTGLPFHINADFYPSEDRKRIIFEKDYQSAWNRAAIKAAAEALDRSLPKLPVLLGHSRLWALLSRLQHVAMAEEADRTEQLFGTFWSALATSLPSSPIVFTAEGTWCKPAEAFYLQQEEERPALAVMQDIGLSFVHEDLRRYQNVITGAPISVRPLNYRHVTEALERQGLTKRFEKDQWPKFLAKPGVLGTLWREMELLLTPRWATMSFSSIFPLRKLALAVSQDGALCPCNTVFCADSPETENTFLRLNPGIQFASPETVTHPLFARLCSRFGPTHAIAELNTLGADGYKQAVEKGAINVSDLIAWFEDRRNDVLAKPNIVEALASLPIYPTAGTFRPLTKVSLPGDFTDPLQLSELIDVAVLPKHHDFLRDLGVKDLTFPVYVSHHLIPALSSEDLDTQKRRDAVLLLACRRSEITANEPCRQALVAAPIVECTDGVFHKSSDAYFQNQTILEVLGDTVPIVALPTEQTTAVSELFRWLEVADKPRLEGVVTRISALTALPPTTESLESVRAVFNHLAERFRNNQIPVCLRPLQTLAWLPTRNKADRWFKPSDVFAIFQDYLFESQGSFLDIDRATQNISSNLFTFLGVKQKPSTSQVVAHLLHCSSSKTIVNQEVFRFLNDNAEDPAVAVLRTQRCILLPDKTYIEPGMVFWSDHPFGRFRKQLGQELRCLDALFKRLGIRENPTHQDALKIISEIDADFGSHNKPLDAEAHTVLLACWRMLEIALEQEALSPNDLALLRDKKCIPNTDHHLTEPACMFFEDRAGLAARFEEFPKANVIPRPIGASKAMAAAGVRTLAIAAEIHLLECHNPTDNPMLKRRVQERRLQLARVLEAQSAHASREAKLAELDNIHFESADMLRIQYTLEAFGRSLASRPENAPVLLLTKDRLLLFVVPEDRYPWPSIARELALALFPDEEPGRIAPGLKEVLAAASTEEAKASLDELGFCILEEAPTATTTGTVTIAALGGEPAPPTPGGEPPVQPPSGTPAPVTEPGLTTPQAIEAMLGPGTTTPNPPPSDLNKPENAPGTPVEGRIGTGSRTEGAGGRAGGEPANMPKQRAPRRGRLRSYVIQDQEPPDGEPDTEMAKQRSSLADAGIAKVVAFEESSVNSRQPEVKPPHHQGYDIESRDAAGKTVRYIEVKSLAGLWGSEGIGVTRPEFEKAREIGERYWLYVVEKADRPDARIYCVQDPARKVDQFLYDNGWQQASVVANP